MQVGDGENDHHLAQTVSRQTSPILSEKLRVWINRFVVPFTSQCSR